MSDNDDIGGGNYRTVPFNISSSSSNSEAFNSRTYVRFKWWNVKKNLRHDLHRLKIKENDIELSFPPVSPWWSLFPLPILRLLCVAFSRIVSLSFNYRPLEVNFCASTPRGSPTSPPTVQFPSSSPPRNLGTR